MDTGLFSGKLNINGAIESDGNSGLRFTPDRDSSPIDSAAYQMEGGCLLHLELTRDGQTLNFRAIIVNDGKELLGIETDAGTTVTLRITALSL
jgi:hypothetical protein